MDTFRIEDTGKIVDGNVVNEDVTEITVHLEYINPLLFPNVSA